MIEELFEDMTPHIINGKKLYDESEIKRAITKMLWLTLAESKGYKPSNKQVEQYPEAGC